MHNKDALGNLPEPLRDELLDAFNKIVKNYRESKWEPSELNAGKLCEVVYTIIKGYVDGSYPDKATKPSNMVDACKNLEQSGSSFPRTVRIQIPRILVALYEVRNNRGVGHVGGDVNPNHMDATMVLYSSKWLLAELVRLYHDVTTQEAAAVVEELVSKEIPTVWKVNDRKRILNQKLSMKHKTLLLLYSENKPVKEEELFDWIEHSNKAVFRRDVLKKGHRVKLWEYDKGLSTVTLSPLGIQKVETELI